MNPSPHAEPKSRTRIRYDDLLSAFEWVSAAAPSGNSAFVSRQTGRLHWASSSHDLEEELPEETIDAAATTLTKLRCVYTHARMEFTWSEVKRNLNLKSHGLDFIDAPSVFEGITFTFEDDRFPLRRAALRDIGSPGWHSCFNCAHGERT